MKILKLYAWEQSFLHEVETIRNTEHHSYSSTFSCLKDQGIYLGQKFKQDPKTSVPDP
jgi:hypothetical protein